MRPKFTAARNFAAFFLWCTYGALLFWLFILLACMIYLHWSSSNPEVGKAAVARKSTPLVPRAVGNALHRTSLCLGSCASAQFQNRNLLYVPTLLIHKTEQRRTFSYLLVPVFLVATWMCSTNQHSNHFTLPETALMTTWSKAEWEGSDRERRSSECSNTIKEPDEIQNLNEKLSQ